MDWHASGIRNTFSYDLVDRFDLDSVIGTLDGVTGGTINETWRGDYRSGLSLDVDGAEFPLGALVRVWHTAQLGDESFIEEMGTFMLADRPKNYTRGRYTGSLSFQSTLYRLGMDRRSGDMAIPNGTIASEKLASVVSNAGGTCYIPSTFDSEATLSTPHIWGHGESCLTECHRLAESLSPRGYIMPDSHGRVTAIKYENPAARAPSFHVGPDSLLLGVDESDAEIVNKVCVSYRLGDTLMFATASVDSSHPWSFDKIGYWAAKHYEASDAPTNNTQAYLNNLASSYLSECSSVSRTFSVRTLYEPLSVGAAGTLEYADSPYDEGIKANVWLKQRQISLDSSMLCELTLEEIL